MEAQLIYSQTQVNRRGERRQRVYKQARIIFNNGYAVFDCIVRNISDGGAMLEMETLLGIPRAFQIVLDHDARARPCRVVWRTERRMGVAFADFLMSA
jgi:PilZ domain-containing protein